MEKVGTVGPQINRVVPNTPIAALDQTALAVAGAREVLAGRVAGERMIGDDDGMPRSALRTPDAR
jgi:hypothetical protein